jgi:SHS2 domain-containing protein
MKEIRELKQAVDNATTLSQLYDVMIDVNERLQDEHIYLSEQSENLASTDVAQVKGDIAMLATIKAYTSDKIEIAKRVDDKAQKRIYNVKVLMKAALPEEQYKEIVNMAYHMSTEDCKNSGERVRELIGI